VNITFSLAFVSLLAAWTPFAHAQRFSGSRIGVHLGGNHAGRYSRGYYPIPWFWDSLYADDGIAPEYPPPPERPPIQRILTTEATPATSTAEPLLIELQDDHYVRLSGEDNSTARIWDLPASNDRESSSLSNAGPPKPAVLVFRDGHREEISAYTISAGTLYAQSDFYSSGSWNQKLELSSLDLPATIAENHSRGIAFQLPKASNEVIVGP
jgi:hypothetical protein